MTSTPASAYVQLVGLIGAPDVHVPVGLVELETIRAIIDATPPALCAYDHDDGLEPFRDRGRRLMRELDHRAGAVAVALGGDMPDEQRVAITTDELELIRGCVDAVRRTSSGRPLPAEWSALLVTLDRRRGGEQYRKAQAEAGGGRPEPGA